MIKKKKIKKMGISFLHVFILHERRSMFPNWKNNPLEHGHKAPGEQLQ